MMKTLTCPRRGCEEPVAEGRRMCRPHLDEACAAAKAAYHARRKGQGSRRKTLRGGGTTDVVPRSATPAVARPVNTMGVNGNVLMVIDATIGALHADVQVLERAREILSRG